MEQVLTWLEGLLFQRCLSKNVKGDRSKRPRSWEETLVQRWVVLENWKRLVASFKLIWAATLINYYFKEMFQS